MKLTSYFYSIALLASCASTQSAQLLKSVEQHICQAERQQQQMIDELVEIGLEEIRVNGTDLSKMKRKDMMALRKNLAALIKKDLEKGSSDDQKQHGSGKFKRHDSI